jgi:RNA polymerase sigma factor (sigma-70 family)
MAVTSPAVLTYVNTLFAHGSLAGLSDGEVLGRFIASQSRNARADAELAFAAIVNRHGPMIWRVCRSHLREEQDAEDAFQATLLVLVRKASSLKVESTLGPWLYSVASRIALSARTAAARQAAIRRKEAARRAGAQCLVESNERVHDPEALALAVHQEVARLPAAFRAAVVLCDIEGQTYHAAAEKLGVPLGTLQSRLARGRRRLRHRLIARGIAPNNAAGPPSSEGIIDERYFPAVGVPAELAGRSARVVVRYAFEGGSLDALCSRARPLSHLVKGARRPAIAYRSLALAGVLTAVPTLVSAILAAGSPAAQRIGAGASSPPPQRTEVPAESRRRGHEIGLLHFPPPFELRVAAGRGKALVFELDADGKRVKADAEIVGLQKRVRKRARAPRRGAEPLPDKEVLRELHWAVVTGVVDHRAIRASFLTLRLAFRPKDDERKVEADRDPEAKDIYRRVDLERQVKDAAGAWSDWQPVDVESNLGVLDNLPEVDGERSLPEFRTNALVDPLPFLKEGKWRGTEVDRFVLAGAPDPQKPELRSNRQIANEQRDPPELMLRCLDFTVEPGQTYRYRVRLVFLTPRIPNVRGPWSQPTEPVTIP